jgi:hypothetical protein
MAISAATPCTATVVAGLCPAAADSSAIIPGTQRVWFKTWGCAHNVSDSEYMMGQLAAYGYRLVGDEERDAADLWLLNSCTVKNPSQVCALVSREATEGGGLSCA